MKIISLFFALLLFTSPVWAVDTAFHPPQTEAEITLNKILELYGQDSDMDGFIFNPPWYKNNKDQKFSPLFTKEFLSIAKKERKEEIKQSCGGTYPENGMECDMLEGIQPIYCASDHPDVFLFQTISSSENQAIISYSGSPKPYKDKTNMHLYKMTLTSGGWSLDGVNCGSGQAVNVHPAVVAPPQKK